LYSEISNTKNVDFVNCASGKKLTKVRMNGRMKVALIGGALQGLVYVAGA